MKDEARQMMDIKQIAKSKFCNQRASIPEDRLAIYK